MNHFSSQATGIVYKIVANTIILITDFRESITTFTATEEFNDVTLFLILNNGVYALLCGVELSAGK